MAQQLHDLIHRLNLRFTSLSVSYRGLPELRMSGDQLEIAIRLHGEGSRVILDTIHAPEHPANPTALITLYQTLTSRDITIDSNGVVKLITGEDYQPPLQGTQLFIANRDILAALLDLNCNAIETILYTPLKGITAK